MSPSSRTIRSPALRLLAAVAGIAALLLSRQVPLHAEEVVKSPHDDRQYEYFVLPNEMKVLIVSDPATDKAAASLDVGVGSSGDPEGRGGLAHFLEHMLFLGTAKYPQAGEYQQFMSAHGGNQNAYTAFEDTNYHFDVDRDSLEPALDRFAQFFIAPLFTADYVAREKNAVHSEYQTRLKEDDRRAYSVLQQLVNPRHPLSHFSVGSLDTLADRPGSPIREELLRFYASHYSANRMALAVLGKEPLPVLRAWVTEKFSAVPNRHLAAGDARPPLFAAGQLPMRVNVVPLMDSRELQVLFPIPPVYMHYRIKPVSYLANLLGHEGAGSLLSLLKGRGWADEVSSGLGLENRSDALFAVSVGLTEAGLAHVDEVVAAIFGYLRLLREQGVEAWRYDEQAQIADLDFRFSEKSAPLSSVRNLSENLQYMAPEDAVRGERMMTRFDGALIRGYLDKLTPQNAIVAVMAQGLPADREDPWYNAAYGASPIGEATLSQWQGDAIDTALALPAPNPFVPDDIAVKDLEPDATAVPAPLSQTAGMDLWFKQDDTYREPRADFYFSVRSPLANNNPRNAVLTELYTRVVTDELNEFAYPALLAGLEFRIYPHIRGFTVRVSGFNDKQEPMLRQIVQTLRAPQFRDERFRVIKEAVIRQLHNVRRENPYQQTLAEISKLMIRPHWSEDSRIAAAGPLTAEDLRRFVPDLLGQVKVVALAHGNLRRGDALALGAVLGEGLVAPAKPVEVMSGRVIRLNHGDYYSRALVIDHPDSSVAAYLQGDDTAPRQRAYFEMLAQVISAPFYHELRTERQLGYVVQASSVPLLDVPGLAFLVQSPTATPFELQTRIDDFLNSYRSHILAMGEEEFQGHKVGLLTRILQNEERMQERSSRYWRELDLMHYRFDSRERLAEAVRGMTREQFQEFYGGALVAPERKMLVVRNLGRNHAGGDAPADGPAANAYSIVEPDAFGDDKSYFSASEPSPQDEQAAGQGGTGACEPAGTACAR